VDHDPESIPLKEISLPINKNTSNSIDSIKIMEGRSGLLVFVC
jgi:hypothetical protein